MANSSQHDVLDEKSDNHKRKHACETCEKSYSFKHNLYRHITTAHPDVSIDNERKPLKCPICDFTPKSAVKLSEHLKLIHDIKLENVQFQFDSETEFLTWKTSIESNNFTNFIKVRGDKMTKDGSRVTYFKCHRSGKYIAKGNGRRRLKSQGSNKINGICPANIKHIKTKEGKIIAHYQRTHVGHENDVGHLYLTTQDKDKLAKKIASNISLDVILDEVRNSLSDSKLERIHLLTKQDLHNIEKCYSITTCNTGTEITIDVWVNEMYKSDKSCVLYYKSQGSEMEELDTDDFVLVIMNEPQSDILKKYGCNQVYIDRTKETNPDGYEMITLMVLDDLKQGFPCAFLVTNRTDSQIISMFFNLLRNKIGVVSTKVFISDVADCFYDSWVDTMIPAKFRLFSSWHVDEDWTFNMTRTIKRRDKQIYVYSILKNLIEETEIATFQTMMDNALREFQSDSDISDFYSYFSTNYRQNCQCWAKCYRIHSGLDLNIHLDKLHRTVHYLYLQGKNTKCLNKSIHAIMQFVRDKLIDRFMVLNKSTLTTHLKNLRSRHRKSLLIPKERIVSDNDDWKIISTSGKELHTIREVVNNCECKIVCPDCSVCVHRYTCTCVDSAIRWNMCKHIHLICQVGCNEAREVEEENNEIEVIFDELQDKTETELYETESFYNLLVPNIEDQKTELMNDFCAILDKVNTLEQIEILKQNLANILVIVNNDGSVLQAL